MNNSDFRECRSNKPSYFSHFAHTSPLSLPLSALRSSLSFSLNEGFFDSAISLPFLVIILYRILWHQTKKHVPIYLNLLTFVSLPIKEEKTVLALISSTVFCVILLLSLFLFSLLPASQTLLPYFQIPKLSFLLPASKTLLPKPSFLLPASQILFPTSCFTNPASQTLLAYFQLPKGSFPTSSFPNLAYYNWERLNYYFSLISFLIFSNITLFIH